MIEWLPEQSPALGDAVEWLGDAVETYQPTGTLEDLVPSVRPQFDALLAQAAAWGMKPHVRSVGRTCAQQQEQVKLGYSHADLCRSMHVLGHAVDLDLTPAACATYTKLGQWWESQGGVWGGRFPGFGDCGDSGHFQYGFAKAGAVPTSVCPSGVTLEQCKQIREQYLDAAFASGAPVTRMSGLLIGSVIIAIGVGFVWAVTRVRPGSLVGVRANPFSRRTTPNPDEKRRHAAENSYWIWAYHTTQKDFLPAIARQGLLAHWHEHVEDAPILFVEPSLEGLAPYLEANSAVLRFKTPGFGSTEDGEDVLFAPDPPLEPYGEGGRIPPERLQVLRNGQWKWLTKERLS